MSDLERRYLWLIGFFYPGSYGHGRATELVGTYLQLAAPGQRWPTFRDVADLAGGGVQQHLRATAATSLRPGLRLAGVLALLTGVALAVRWSVLEVQPSHEQWSPPPVGPFVSLGAAVWAAWLLTAVAFAVDRGRGWARMATGLALVITVAVVPVSTLTGLLRPPLFVLVAQAALGVVALGAGGGFPLWVRLLPLGVVAATVPIVLQSLSSGDSILGYYGYTIDQTLTAAGITLLIAAVLLGVTLAARGDAAGGWALLVLIGPIGMLFLREMAGTLASQWYGGGPIPDWKTLATSAIIVTTTAAAALLFTLTIRHHIAARPDHRCASCGAPARKQLPNHDQAHP
ncbi:hypothetical protein AB0J83_44510 [Actinoplanes sp. NPDC049596]|uniref:hypothetical protein n=1 Tax=unclassified Actinoplanes TaxID=2626549 RepID=UPI003418720C